MRQKLNDPGAFETRRVAAKAAMREDILGVEFNTLGEPDLGAAHGQAKSLPPCGCGWMSGPGL